MGSDQYVPRCGDTVLHKPSGETWTVAYTDAARDELAWCGWPEGWAKLSDCEITNRCTDEEHMRLVSEWCDRPNLKDNGEPDMRVGRVRAIYRQEPQQ